MLDASTLQSLISSNTKNLCHLEADVASLEMAISLYDDTPFFSLECTKECILLLTKEIKNCKKKIVKYSVLQKKLRRELAQVYGKVAWAKYVLNFARSNKDISICYDNESFQTVKECLAMDEVEAHWHGRAL